MSDEESPQTAHEDPLEHSDPPDLQPSKREILVFTLDDVRRELAELPQPGIFSIFFGVLVILTFSAGLAFTLLKMAQGGMPSDGRGAAGQLLGVLFFLLPIVFSGRFVLRRIEARKRRRELLAAEKELLALIEKCKEPDPSQDAEAASKSD